MLYKHLLQIPVSTELFMRSIPAVSHRSSYFLCQKAPERSFQGYYYPPPDVPPKTPIYPLPFYGTWYAYSAGTMPQSKHLPLANQKPKKSLLSAYFPDSVLPYALRRDPAPLPRSHRRQSRQVKVWWVWFPSLTAIRYWSGMPVAKSGLAQSGVPHPMIWRKHYLNIWPTIWNTKLLWDAGN